MRHGRAASIESSIQDHSKGHGTSRLDRVVLQKTTESGDCCCGTVEHYTACMPQASPATPHIVVETSANLGATQGDLTFRPWHPLSIKRRDNGKIGQKQVYAGDCHDCSGKDGEDEVMADFGDFRRTSSYNSNNNCPSGRLSNVTQRLMHIEHNHVVATLASLL